MLRIAICDDEKTICRQLEDMLHEIAGDAELEIETDVYYTGEELCEFLMGERHYDIIFLDIELNTTDGVRVGRKIREEFEDELTQIVYISFNESYAMELFDVRPLNFMIKPLNKGKIEAVLMKALKLMHLENNFFEYKNGNVTFSISLRDVLYFESSGRKVNIVMNGETRSFYGKLSDVEEQVGSRDFVMIHKSYLINFRHCIEYTYEYVRMSNQEVLTISQNNRKSVREKLMQRKLRSHHDK